MARTEQRDKITWPIRHSRDTRSQPEYLAKLVEAGELCEFVRSCGGGDLAASWVAGRQLALITSQQLKAAGIDKDAIAVRRRHALLHRVHHGVYLWGQPTMLPGARELAAVLACHGFVSHQSAAALWGLAETAEGDTHVSVIGRGCSWREGIRVHRVRTLDAPDHRLLRGIPITSPARTLVDFAHQVPPDQLERAIAEAYALRLVTEAELQAAVDRGRNRPGVAALRAELRRDAGPRLTRREGERRMLKLLREARLPQPLTNTRVAGLEVDFLWPEHRLIVEFDGYQFHGHRRTFERDRRRDQAHIAAGYTVIRVTWRQLTEEPLSVIAIIARLLGREQW
jgi:very-short-patch-repair endonuclease